jgi:hypothetical protein
MVFFNVWKRSVKSFIRTTVLITPSQDADLKWAAETDPVGLRVAQLIRLFVDEGLARRKRVARQTALTAPPGPKQHRAK